MIRRLFLKSKMVGLDCLAVKQNRQHQRLGQEVLCNLNVEGAEVLCLHSFTLRLGELFETLSILLCCPDVDLVSHLHELGGLSDQVCG